MACGSGCCGPPKAPIAATVDHGLPTEVSQVTEKVPEATPKQSTKTGCDDGTADEDDCCKPAVTLSVGCQDACCGGSVDVNTKATTQDESSTQTIANDNCKKGCCGEATNNATINPELDDCCEQESIEDDCKKGCCGGPAENTPRPPATDDWRGGPSKAANKTDDCCVTKYTEVDCKEGCCTAPAPLQTEDPNVPSCCKGKSSPCCDDTCLDRLALRECQNGKHLAQSDGSSACGKTMDGKPCASHTRATRERYAATLDALGCICRALISLGQESCCAPRERTSVERKRCSKKSSFRRTSVDSCCSVGGTCTAQKRPSSKKGYSIDRAKAKPDSCSAGCCSSPKAPSIAGSCADDCCAEEKPAHPIQKVKEIATDVAHATDPEKGLSGGEHIILSISGMTCTGCETKLKRTLGTLRSVKNLKTSLVLSRAEFDLDYGAGTLVDVMKHLERTTEFKCEKVSNQGACLDVLVPGDAAEFVHKMWPDGATEVNIVDKRTVNVAFDAKIIGARDLLEKGWDFPLELAPLRPDPTLAAGSKHVRHVGYMTLLSIVFTIPVLVLAWAPLPEHDIAYSSASLALATIVQIVIAGPFYPKALKALVFSKVIEMDLLIVLSTSAAYIFSVVSFVYLVAGQPLSTGQFFETSTLLVTLIMVGRYVAALARQKAVESISIRSLQTSNAILVDEAGEGKEIDSRLLQYGDVFKIMPDSKVPTDGTVISGSSEIDESMLTGESKPVEKYTKSKVIAGSINGSGTLVVRLDRLPGDNTISTIAEMVDEAKLAKPRIQDIADRVASYFVPVVVTLSIITFVTWVAVGVAVRKRSGSEATIQAITYAITVLIVSCPCAIGLAVPMVVVISSGIAAEKGVIFKSAESIESAYKTKHVVLDKTGTLTQGKLTVVKENYMETSHSSAKSLLLGLVESIKHPVSAAVAAHLKAQDISPSPVINAKTLTGKGVEGSTSGLVLRAGNSHWLGMPAHPAIQFALSGGYTAFCFTINDSLAAVFALEDSLRPDAAATVESLTSRGITVHVLSGDDDGAVRSVATQLHIDEANVRSRCSPADKQAYIHALLSKTSPEPVVMFCGDGTNDAVALAQATVGVHMNEGTDVAKSAADVVLMRPSLSGILTAIAVSEKSIHRIRFNFGWSFVYNLFAILLGAGAFVNARIPPEFAGLGELVSVLPVIAAAVMLRWSKLP